MAKLRAANRSCVTAEVALSDKEGSAQFVVAGGLSGLMQHQSSYNEGRITQAQKDNNNVITVATSTFAKVMEQAQIEAVDFLSIDVEGAEMTILQTLDFDRFDIASLAIENNEKTPHLCEFLSGKGYSCLGHLHILDELFVKRRS